MRILSVVRLHPLIEEPQENVHCVEGWVLHDRIHHEWTQRDWILKLSYFIFSMRRTVSLASTKKVRKGRLHML